MSKALFLLVLRDRILDLLVEVREDVAEIGRNRYEDWLKADAYQPEFPIARTAHNEAVARLMRLDAAIKKMKP